jgi:hypothetical protein
VTGALELLDAPADERAVQQALWRVRAAAGREAPAAAAPVARPRSGRFALGALGRAAALLVAFAGALAAIPGSPVNRLVTQLFADGEERGAERVPEATSPAPVPPAPAVAAPRPALPGVMLLPAAGQVRVLVWEVAPGAIIRVNLVDGNRVSVEAGSDAEDVRFRTGNGRIEVMNLGHAEAIIQIPRSLPIASLDVDGRQWLFKDGDQLRLTGPVVEQATDAVVFRAGH